MCIVPENVTGGARSFCLFGFCLRLTRSAAKAFPNTTESRRIQYTARDARYIFDPLYLQPCCQYLFSLDTKAVSIKSNCYTLADLSDLYNYVITINAFHRRGLEHSTDWSVSERVKTVKRRQCCQQLVSLL